MTTTTELQINRIKERFLNVKADYKRNGATIRVQKDSVIHVFYLENCSIEQLEDLLSEWGETRNV